MSQATDSSRFEYDIIFAGGGTSACVAAGRLAAGDPSLRILIIEAGGHTRDVPQHVEPGHFCNNLKTRTDLFWHHVGAKSEALGGRAPIVSSGRCMGGGSSVNFMFYARASASDYDDWEKLGNPGWGSRELIPLSAKAETHQGDLKSRSTHGYNGPIKVSRSGPKETFTVGEQYLDVARAYDPERGFTEDTEDFKSCNLYGRYHRYVDADTGRRSDVAHNYIYSEERNKNVHIKVHNRVCRIIIENNRAVGVEYSPEETGAVPAEKPCFKAFASRLVVVSGGAFGSPTILQRSGIASKALLERLQIPQVVDLPGVGENYLDHNLIFVPYLTEKEVVSFNQVLCASEDELSAQHEEWVKNGGQSIMSTNGVNSGIKLRPHKKDLEILGDSFAPVWEAQFANRPDKPVLWTGNVAGLTHFLIPGDDNGRRCFQIGYFSEYPLAIGHVRISSADPFAPLDFDPRYLEHEADLAVLRWGYKHTREMARRMECFRGEYAPLHPTFPEGSPAATKEVDGPVAISDPDIVYTAEDDKAIDVYLKAFVGTTWHSMGTCAMRPRDQGGVVDPRLNVYGVENLKVVDLSIAPLNVAANTYNTAIIIGEKAAEIIAEELSSTKTD